MATPLYLIYPVLAFGPANYVLFALRTPQISLFSYDLQIRGGRYPSNKLFFSILPPLFSMVSRSISLETVDGSFTPDFPFSTSNAGQCFSEVLLGFLPVWYHRASSFLAFDGTAFSVRGRAYGIFPEPDFLLYVTSPVGRLPLLLSLQSKLTCYVS